MREKPAEYDGLSKLNHWIVGGLVLVMLALGLIFDELPRGDTRNMVFGWHLALGGLVAPLVIWRVLYRIAQGLPRAYPAPAWQVLASKVVHWALLAAIAVLAISGPLAVWTGGHTLNVLGLLPIPSPTGELKDLHEVLGDVHGIAANAAMWLIGIHVLATLKHIVIDRDGLMRRMLPKRGKS
jgi:cytochrome b561